MPEEYNLTTGIQVGSKVPAWSAKAYMPNGDFVDIESQGLRGKWLVLFFWPLDFTFVCPTEIRTFAEQYNEFKSEGAEVIGCSTDSVYSHKAWVEGPLGKIPFAIIGDASHRLSRLFGVHLNDLGVALRGTFIIDPDGTLVSATVNSLSVGRNVDETLRTLRAFQVGELMPCGWTPGTATLGKA